MRSLTNTSNERRSNDRATAGTSIRLREKLPEQAYLEREAALAKGAIRRSLAELRRVAHPLVLTREHPVVAGVLIGGAAAGTVALLVSSSTHEGDGTGTACRRETARRPERGRLLRAARAVGRGLMSLLVSKVLLGSGDARVSDSSQPVD